MPVTHGRITAPPDSDIINSKETYSSAVSTAEEVRLQVTLFMKRSPCWLLPPCGNTSDTVSVMHITAIAQNLLLAAALKQSITNLIALDLSRSYDCPPVSGRNHEQGGRKGDVSGEHAPHDSLLLGHRVAPALLLFVLRPSLAHAAAHHQRDVERRQQVLRHPHWRACAIGCVLSCMHGRHDIAPCSSRRANLAYALSGIGLTPPQVL